MQLHHHHTNVQHGVPGSNAQQQRRPGILFHTSKQCFLVLATAIPSFLLGTTVALYSRLDDRYGSSGNVVNCGGVADSPSDPLESLLAARVQQAVHEEKAKWMEECYSLNSRDVETLLDQSKVGNYASTMALVSKQKLTDHLDLGVPVDPSTKKGSTHAMVIYMKEPTPDAKGQVLEMNDAEAAFESCDTVNIVLSDHSNGRKQCLAIVPQYESFHLQHWMRVDEKTGKVNSNSPLQLVSRGYKDTRNEFPPPSRKTANRAIEILTQYFHSLPDVLKELGEILKKIAIKNTVIVMVCNFGQSELLLNFLCQARARKFDISNLIVFATDDETYQLAQNMGVAAYYDKRVRVKTEDAGNNLSRCIPHKTSCFATIRTLVICLRKQPGATGISISQQ